MEACKDIRQRGIRDYGINIMQREREGERDKEREREQSLFKHFVTSKASVVLPFLNHSYLPLTVCRITTRVVACWSRWRKLLAELFWLAER